MTVVAFDADWQLVRKLARRLDRAVAKGNARDVLESERLLKKRREIRDLALFRAKPGMSAVRQHRIQDHQALNHPTQRRRPGGCDCSPPIAS